MKKIPATNHPLVIRTSFDNELGWQRLCSLIRAPVQDGADQFYAYVDFLDSMEYQDLSKQSLLKRLPKAYSHNFLFIADQTTLNQPELPILVVDLYQSKGREFRALPTQIQAVQNNLSIANMDLTEFANAVDSDGIFRGFSRAQ